MKKWLAACSMLGVMCLCTPVSFASDGVQHPSTPAHSGTDVRSIDDNHDMPARPGNKHEFDVQSSIQVNRDVLREAYEASHQAYTQKLAKYAKISSRQAQKQIASAHPKMNVEHVQLRNIRTSLVYMGVAVDDSDRFLVVVDAGNGKVLLDRHLPSHHTRVFAGD